MRFNICIIANEPAPYNIDLFNAFSENEEIDLTVVHTTEKIWTSSHDFKEFPDMKYKVQINSGKGIIGKLKASLNVFGALCSKKQIVIVAGYVSLQSVIAIISCIVLHIPFAFWTDQFNTGDPRGLISLKKPARDVLRYVIFRTAFAVLVAGEPGMKSALRVGCPSESLVNFPYTIDPERFQKNYDASLPVAKDVFNRARNRIVIFYSGRFLCRKGLDVLLNAVSLLQKENMRFYLIIEGEGSLKEQYKRLAGQLKITDYCHFIGFNQMREHATLLKKSDIVVVPSYYDPWGLVVQEGMLSKKPVVASDQVGSALDRIRHGENGFIFRSGDYKELAKYLILLMKDKALREKIGENAKINADIWIPKRNVEAFLNKVKEKRNITKNLA